MIFDRYTLYYILLGYIFLCMIGNIRITKKKGNEYSSILIFAKSLVEPLEWVLSIISLILEMIVMIIWGILTGIEYLLALIFRKRQPIKVNSEENKYGKNDKK